MRSRHSFAICAVLAALGLLSITILMAFSKFGDRTRAPTLQVLDEPQHLVWESIDAEMLDHPPWAAWPLSHIASGSGERKIEIFKHGQHTTLAFPGPKDGNAHSIKLQRLFDLHVPEGSLSAIVIATGDVSFDGSEYMISFEDVSSVSAECRLAYIAEFDADRRELSVAIGCAAPHGPGRCCRLRYRLTPEGFAFLGPREQPDR